MLTKAVAAGFVSFGFRGVQSRCMRDVPQSLLFQHAQIHSIPTILSVTPAVMMQVRDFEKDYAGRDQNA
jgi:hypothetical protein